MIVTNNQNLNQLQLIAIAFFLLLCFSIRGLFASLSILAIRTNDTDWDTISNLIALKLPLTTFETITLGFNFVASIVALIVFVVTMYLSIKEYRRHRRSLPQSRK